MDHAPPSARLPCAAVSVARAARVARAVIAAACVLVLASVSVDAAYMSPAERLEMREHVRAMFVHGYDG